MSIKASEISDLIKEKILNFESATVASNVGTVVSVTDGIVRIHGLANAAYGEMLEFPENTFGLALNLEQDSVGAVVLGDYLHISEGDTVKTTGRILEVPVGEALLGRVVSPLGVPLDGKGPIKSESASPIEKVAPGVIWRQSVDQPVQTGLKAIDAMVPVGRGQRELIIGDRQTGKTAIAVDAILNQTDSGVLSVYCAIGQRASAVARVIQSLREGGAMDRTIVVVASGEDAPGLQFVAPYAATSMAEHFMAEGRDVLIVYDDLTRHARAYRELSLLLRRPPGREAYPGDIFYIHSRLLERATQLREEHGGGSLTALPVVETQAQNISAYIPTNLISITDGQVYLSPSLFEKGHLPAIDIGTSVSRVGGKVQLPAFRAVAGNLRLMYAQFEELETFARFGTQLDAETRRKLTRGLRVREVLKQREHDHLDVPGQIAALLAATEGLFDELEPDAVAEAERTVREAVRARAPDVCNRITAGAKLGPEDRAALIDLMRDALSGAEPEAADGHA